MTVPLQLLVFDLDAILNYDPNLWRDVSRLGECLLPEIVDDCIHAAAQGTGPASSNEAKAKLFQRSRPQLGWKVARQTASHPLLTPQSASGSAMSAKARQDLSVMETAHAIAQANPDRPVVLVSDNAKMRERITQLDLPNLSSTSSAIARQSARTRLPLTTAPTPDVAFQKKKRMSLHLGDLSTRLLLLLLLALVVLYGGRILLPQQFRNLWQRTGLPPLPQLPFEPAQRP
ncbi:MAG: hypothetical protein HC919_04705 [Oscillatoriales cyanobacterium SM2_2_1]|nr:hypothetical protein [Oscillatoriales cyanobacterium SM2_2_1]